MFGVCLKDILKSFEFVHVGHGLPEDFFVYSCYRFVIVLEPPTLHPFWWPNGLKHLIQHILKNDSHGCCWPVGLTSTELESMHVHTTILTHMDQQMSTHVPAMLKEPKKKSLLNACITRKPWHETLLLKRMHLKSITGFDSYLLQELKAFEFPMLLFSCTVLHVLHECYRSFLTLYRLTMNQPWFAKTGPLLTFLLGPGFCLTHHVSIFAAVFFQHTHTKNSAHTRLLLQHGRRCFGQCLPRASTSMSLLGSPLLLATVT